jgi:hypothetical protein
MTVHGLLAAAPTTITLTPIASMTNLPIGTRVVAALRAAPEGLQLLQAATLTITVPGGPPTPAPGRPDETPS